MINDGTYHRSTFLQLTTFFQFHLVSAILPQSLTSFFGIFRWDIVFIAGNFSRFLIEWRNWNVTTLKRCCLILKAFGTVQRSIFSYNYIQPTSLHALRAKSDSRRRSEPSCRCSSIFEDEATITSISAHKTRFISRVTVPTPEPCVASLRNTWSDFEFVSSANCKKVGPKSSAAYHNE